jgi:peptide/nickel transport system permease protein
LRGNPRALIGAAVLAVIVLGAVFADQVSPYPPNQQNLRNRLQPPSAENLLGTDQFGRDVLSRIIHGGRVSLQVGFVSVAIALGIGGLMGSARRLLRWPARQRLLGLVDVLLALPAFLLALAIVAALGPSLMNVMIAVGVATCRSSPASRGAPSSSCARWTT